MHPVCLNEKYLVPVSDRPCQFMCDPNYFMSLGKKIKKIIILKKIKNKSQKNTNSADNMLGGSIAAVKKKSPTYHSLPLEK